MCGRFIMTVDFEMLKAAFRLRAQYLEVKPGYNIAPGQDIPVVVRSSGGREIVFMRWGLIPHWSRDEKSGYKMINARAETVAEKPAFRSSFRYRRCLVPATGFYEWKREGKVKQPVLVTFPGHDVIAFAGIWDRWHGPDGTVVDSCSIITTTAAPGIRNIHDRMPVILAGEREYDTWLSGDDPVAPGRLLRPYSGVIEAYPVSTRVNSPRASGPELMERFRDDSLFDV